MSGRWDVFLLRHQVVRSGYCLIYVPFLFGCKIRHVRLGGITKKAGQRRRSLDLRFNHSVIKWSDTLEGMFHKSKGVISSQILNDCNPVALLSYFIHTERCVTMFLRRWWTQSLKQTLVCILLHITFLNLYLKIDTTPNWTHHFFKGAHLQT